MQLIGKVREPMIRKQARMAPRWARRYLTSRSVDWWLFTEDLPDPNNRIEVTGEGAIRVHWRQTMSAHTRYSYARPSGWPGRPGTR